MAEVGRHLTRNHLPAGRLMYALSSRMFRVRRELRRRQCVVDLPLGFIRWASLNGHFQTYDWPRNHHANDRFESPAAIGRLPLEGAHPPKRSLEGRRRLSTPDAGPTSAGRSAEQVLPTHCSRRLFSQRATGLLRNLTFARGVEKVSDGGSGGSNVASIDRRRSRRNDCIRRPCTHTAGPEPTSAVPISPP